MPPTPTTVRFRLSAKRVKQQQQLTFLTPGEITDGLRSAKHDGGGAQRSGSDVTNAEYLRRKIQVGRRVPLRKVDRAALTGPSGSSGLLQTTAAGVVRPAADGAPRFTVTSWQRAASIFHDGKMLRTFKEAGFKFREFNKTTRRG